MRVLVEDVKKNRKKLKDIKDSYSKICERHDNTIADLNVGWNSEKAHMFYNEFDEERINSIKNLENIDDMYNLLNYIIEQYDKIGNNIYYNPSNTIVEKLDKYITKLENVLRAYDTLDKSKMIGSEISTINAQRSNYASELSKAKQIKTKAKKIISQIENNEKNIMAKTGSIKVELATNIKPVVGD